VKVYAAGTFTPSTTGPGDQGTRNEVSMSSQATTTSIAGALFAVLAGFASAPAQASCGSAYCAVNTDLAAEAAGIVEGSTLDLRYEAITQKQPRSGSDRIAVGAIPHHHDEVSTRNRNLVGTFNHTFASGWGISASVPFVDREHLHIHHHRGAQLQEQWSFRELGDLRLTGRYQRALASDTASSTVGAIAGLKLPTGRTGIANDAGSVAERSLQPGTGTTDLIVGGYIHHQLPARAASVFAQAQYQRALGEHDGYRPGAQFTVDLGYGQAFTEKLSGIVQVNAVVKGRDRGANAEPADSGSRSFYLSPGLSWQLTERIRAYAFYQHPLHQHVNGVQLTADRAFLVGVSTRF
jgi:hypothetical protein